MPTRAHLCHCFLGKALTWQSSTPAQNPGHSSGSVLSQHHNTLYPLTQKGNRGQSWELGPKGLLSVLLVMSSKAVGQDILRGEWAEGEGLGVYSTGSSGFLISGFDKAFGSPRFLCVKQRGHGVWCLGVYPFVQHTFSEPSLAAHPAALGNAVILKE